MKKIIPIVIIFITFVALAVYISIDRSKTNINIDKYWIVEGSVIDKIELYGTEQPVVLSIVETDNVHTRVSVSGQVSEDTVTMVEKAELTGSNLYVPFSKKGFKLATTSFGKATLMIEIQLGKDVQFKDVSLDTWNGTVAVVVPANYDGKYDVKLNNGAKMVEIPSTTESTEHRIIIDAYEDVTITKGE